MSFSLDRLVVGVASSALFDLSESDTVFREQGEEQYRAYQNKNINIPLKKGVAFSFIQRLLSLNEISSNDPLVEIILLSRNDPDTGLRVFRSIHHHKLNITRAAFLEGNSPHQYIGAFECELFLSANSQDVNEAVRAGYPAGRVLDNKKEFKDPSDDQLRIAFDFDGVIIDDEVETINVNEGLDSFHQHETEKAHLPHNEGPLGPFLKRIARIQELEKQEALQDPKYVPKLRISVVTARNAPSHERVITTLKDWGINVNEAFFLGGIEKKRVLERLKPHIFFDDQMTHLESSQDLLPSVHVPFGIKNI